MCVCLSVSFILYQAQSVALVLVHVFPLFDFVSLPWELIHFMSMLEMLQVVYDGDMVEQENKIKC